MTKTTVVEAALKWFKSKRPAHWTVEQHLAQPTVNCRGELEFELAEAVAQSLKK